MFATASGLSNEDLAQAACSRMDPELFYPEIGKANLAKEAKKKGCQVCPIRQKCLDAALFNEEQWGVWGGMTTKERRKYQADLRKRQGLPPKTRREPGGTCVVK